MRNTTVNVGPLLVTLAVVFTTYFGAALAMPAMPAGIQAALVSFPVCLPSMKARSLSRTVAIERSQYTA